MDALAGLDEEQRAVAEAVSGPVVVLAGAGTGKTRAITHRIAHAVALGVHEPRRTLAVTFTNRAAGEMRARLAELGVEGVSARTFHASALRQLRYFWPRLTGSAFPALLPSKARLVAEAARACGVSVDSAQLRDLVTDLEWAKARELGPDALPTERQWSIDRLQVASVLDAYDEAKSAAGVIDFEDVLAMLAELLSTRPDVADEVRTQYRWFTVDEYQDVSPLQHRVLRLWLGDRDDLCVVGDVSQTIYSFAGASASYLLDFTREFPQATSVRLVNCYRCSGPIVLHANALVAGRPGALSLRAVDSAGVEPELTSHADDVAEAEAVADAVRSKIVKGVSPQNIAVLFRVNAQSAELERAFAERGIPVTMRGSERFFDRGEVREVVTRLRGAARGGMEGTASNESRAVLSVMGWSAAPPDSAGAVRERWESLDALVTLADDLPVGSDLTALVAELDRRASAQHAPAANAVTLASLHAAKGLEWDAVFIIGCSEGLLPLSHAKRDEEIEEERRLLYVGVTRAKSFLSLTWARSRHPGGRESREPSRFLAELKMPGAEVAAQGFVARGTGSNTRERKRTGPARCRLCRKALVTPQERTLGRCRTCPSSIDMDLLETLKSWRKEEAAERDVPAYVVFTDATLMAVAEQKPTNDDALLSIPGIGPAKLEAFGSVVLRLVGEARDPALDLPADGDLSL
jgi:DNA helicase II / ATP-dependent DNA helicase PcrA